MNGFDATRIIKKPGTAGKALHQLALELEQCQGWPALIGAGVFGQKPFDRGVARVVDDVDVGVTGLPRIGKHTGGGFFPLGINLSASPFEG